MNFAYRYLLTTLLFFAPLATAISQELYLDDVFSKVAVSTHQYATKDYKKLKLDLYQPENDTSKQRPVLVWIHGGGFAGGQRDNPDEVKLMKAMARKGYVSASISYRLLRKGKKSGFSCDCPKEEKIRVFKEAASDFMDAVSFLKNQQLEFGIDTSTIIIGGSSAGAETVLTAAFSRDQMFANNQSYLDLNFAAVISLAGAMVDSRYVSPENAIPAIFFHGTKDNLVPYATAPHHYCSSDKAGYLWLDGSHTISQKLEELHMSQLLYTFVNARHEISRIPFDHLDIITAFLKDVVIDQKYRSLSFEE